MSDDIVGMYEFVDAVEAAIESADPDKLVDLAAVIQAYQEDFPEEFYWAVGATAPVLLHRLMVGIDCACRTKEQSKPQFVQLVPKGNA